MKTLHFALGPVQGFVAQARRTRDFWVGSFLLSWLSGQAMYEVQQGAGTIIFPAIQGDPLLRAIEATKSNKPADIPAVATLPNRFMAEVPKNFDPTVCVNAVRTAWGRIADEVYKQYILPVEHLGNNTRAIWERQVEGYWDIFWAIGEDRRTLDRRKNWRVHVPTIEPGDKCTLMGNLQELSGVIREKGNPAARQRDEFWKALRGKVGIELRHNERLCAIAFVKRMFPAIARNLQLNDVPESYPSTSTLAGVHWLSQVAIEEPELCMQYAEKAVKLGKNSEQKVQLVDKLISEHQKLSDFFQLNPNCYFINSLENDNVWEEDDRKLREELKKLLKQFGYSASPFYALLLMDGDKMGQLLSKNATRDQVTKVSEALGKFSNSVPGIVDGHNGVCVYAGGDDVFAMLPLEDALPTAVKLQKKYKECFAEYRRQLNDVDSATLSGAIIYVHHNIPLQVAIREAHNTLASVAKEQSGRDSLAIKVWKASGPNLSWSAPWEVVIPDGETTILDKLLEDFSAKEQKQFTSSFFYNLQQRFSLLSSEEGNLKLGSDDIKAILEAEYLKSRKLNHENQEQFSERAKENIEHLLKVCRRSWRENGVLMENQGGLELDGALLVKFLATKGVER